MLQTYSLVQWRDNQDVYAMHKLVHAWDRERLEMYQQRELSEAALELLTDIVPIGHRDVVLRTRLVPHVMANFKAVSMAYSLSNASSDLISLVAVSSDFLHALG